VTRVLLDCDPGHDDAMAIMLALASPEVELVGITTVAGNQTLECTTANAIRVLDLLDRQDIPVAAGASRPLVRERRVAAEVHGETGSTAPSCRTRRAPRSPSMRSTGWRRRWPPSPIRRPWLPRAR
jgi:inosine-uridine nucleoside N-ribohydrolase